MELVEISPVFENGGIMPGIGDLPLKNGVRRGHLVNKDKEVRTRKNGAVWTLRGDRTLPTEQPRGIAVEQQPQQNFRRIGFSPLGCILRINLAQIKLDDQIDHKAR